MAFEQQTNPLLSVDVPTLGQQAAQTQNFQGPAATVLGQKSETGESVGHIMDTTGRGAASGASVGGGWGAIIGGAIGLVEGVVGTIIQSRNDSEEERKAKSAYQKALDNYRWQLKQQMAHTKEMEEAQRTREREQWYRSRALGQQTREEQRRLERKGDLKERRMLFANRMVDAINNREVKKTQVAGMWRGV